MRQILDLHIHSRYSRACSRDLTLSNIDQVCRIKGVDIIATGDFTYPAWFTSIKNELESLAAHTGLFKLKSSPDDKIKFILSTEFALIYKQGDRCRRIHLVVQAPNMEAAVELNKFLDKHYNIRSDGRPILGMSAPDLVKLCLSIHPQFLIYPAHIWTPWFSVFGSKSGFDSLENCFGDYTQDIYAYETGLSSDPEMNWRVSALDKLALLSNSDAHSLPNIGRECNIFDLTEISYNEIYQVIKQKDLRQIISTIEFFPEEGMYHLDGHRLCGVSFEPSQAKSAKGICHVCRKPLTVGVLNRVEELADRVSGQKPDKNYGFNKVVSLDKIIAEALNVKSRNSSKVQKQYQEMIKQGNNEFNILLNLSEEDLKKIAPAKIVTGIIRSRKGELVIQPGFDGQYGVINIFSPTENRQESLF